jgi:hypothetical protein
MPALEVAKLKTTLRYLSYLLLALLCGISVSVFTGFFVENLDGWDELFGIEHLWRGGTHLYGYPLYWRIVYVPTNQVTAFFGQVSLWI